jgi:putative polyketide hydroxylase
VVRLARPLGVILGANYDSRAIVPDGTPAPEVTNPITDYRPSARPGQRAPHAWLDAARTTSTLDLFGDGFVLLTGDRTTWGSAAASARTTGVPLRLEDRDPTAWAGLYGIHPDGAVLVRPDGYVAARWPTAPAHPDSALRDTIRVLTRPSPGRNKHPANDLVHG